MEDFKIVPLAGSSETEPNAVVCEYQEKIIVLNLGAGIVNGSYVIPNVNYLKDNKHRIEGVFLTSIHADNIGGILSVLADLNYPDVFADELTLDLLRKRLIENNSISKAKLHSIKSGSTLKSGDLHLHFFSLAENAPHSLGVHIHTPNHNVVYAQRFHLLNKSLPDYQNDFGYLGQITQPDLLILGAAGSTKTTSSSTLETIIKHCLNNRIIISTASTNWRTISEIINFAHNIDYKVCFLGRSMQQMWQLALKHHLIEIPNNVVIHYKNLNRVNNKKLIIIASGKRSDTFIEQLDMLRNGLQGFKLAADDSVLIGKTDQDLRQFYNEMQTRGITVYEMSDLAPTSSFADTHEQQVLINMLSPRYLLPLTGEIRHMQKTILSAKESSNVQVIKPENGQEYILHNHQINNSSKQDTSFVPIGDADISVETAKLTVERQNLANGIILLAIRLRGQDNISLRDLHLDSRGFIYMPNHKALINKIRAEVIALVNENLQSDIALLQEKITVLLQNKLEAEIGKTPTIVTDIFR